MDGARLSTNPNCVINRDLLIVTRPRVWYPCEWTEPLDQLYTHPNELDLWTTDEGIRSMGSRSNLILGVVPNGLFHPPSSILRSDSPWAPHKKVSNMSSCKHFALEQISQKIHLIIDA